MRKYIKRYKKGACDAHGSASVAGGMTPVATKDKGSEIYLKS